MTPLCGATSGGGSRTVIDGSARGETMAARQ
ncbi:MAG: hypothetical protein AVDCRST_MAG88-1973, partial [uncultured Thermomicrobiales bacterium]